MKTEYQNQLVNANREFPCPHCGKPDWCYRLGDLSVCNRDVEPDPGWYKTNKIDAEGHYFYAPDRQKAPIKKEEKHWIYTDKCCEKLVRVTRIDKESTPKPIRFQESWDGQKWVKGLKNVNRSDIAIYRYQEIKEAIARQETIYIVEGEKCADAMWDIGLAATTNIGGAKKWKASDTACLEGVVEVVICPDRDKAGVEHGLLVSEEFPDALWLYAPPSQFYWLSDHLPESQGLDVADWIENGVDKESVKAQITTLSPGKFSESLPLHEKPKEDEIGEKNREVIVEAEEIYTQKAVDCLFSDSAYIAIHDKLYKYNGTHYELCSTPRERRRILEWCKSTPVQQKGKWVYGLAKPETVNKIWVWVLTSFAVDPEEVNPPGINCLNGVLRISWTGRKCKYELVPHDPDFYFTHVGNFEYNSEADDRDCERLLAALDPAQQIIFLRTIAASLDLNTVRKYQGRAVKALLCQGTGSNGKDTLREAVRCILGAGMTGASVTDFQQYDQGRKFPLTKIEHSQINWSSENSQFARLDSLQGLKAAITGETIDIEPKNAIEYPITPRGVFLFNVNESPLLEGGMEAIASRWSVLAFNKTFKKNANPLRGELEADSRFRYDSDFLEQAVCPALLNKILEQLQLVVLEGIDYSPCDGALQKIQEQSNHLWQFVNQVGIVEAPGKRLYIKDLWQRLKAWYIDEGALEADSLDDDKTNKWGEDLRKGDRLVRSSNQISRRFQELFPNVEKKRHTERDNSDRRNQAYFSGLAIVGADDGKARTTQYVGGADGADGLAILAKLVTELESYSQSERLTAIALMENFIEKQTDLGNSSAPSAPADSTRDSALPPSAPEEEKRSQERSQSVTVENAHKSTSGDSDKTNVNHLTFTVFQDVTIPIDYDNVIHSCSDREIEWVRKKDGTSYNIDRQEGLKLIGHRPGMRGHEEIWIDECEEIHYKKDTVETET